MGRKADLEAEIQLQAKVLRMHNLIQSALERDPYANYVGRFRVREMEGGINLTHRGYGDREPVKVQIESVQGYRVHLQQDPQEVVDHHPASADITYNGISRHPDRRDFTVRIGDDESHVNREPPKYKELRVTVEGDRWYSDGRTAGITLDTLSWLHEQLTTPRELTIYEKADQLFALVKYGTSIKGDFPVLHTPELKTRPSWVQETEGKWMIYADKDRKLVGIENNAYEMFVSRIDDNLFFTFNEKREKASFQSDGCCYQLCRRNE